MNNEQLDPHELLQQFQITEADLQLIRNFGARPEVEVKSLIADFYTWLQAQVWFGQYFSSGVPAKVQSLQYKYWQGFLEPNVDTLYVNERVTIGRVHATINLPVSAYLAGMNFAQTWFAEIAKVTIDDSNACLALMGAINKLIQLDSNIVMHVYSMQSMAAVQRQSELTTKIVTEATRVAKLAADGDFNTTYRRQDDSDNLERPINRMISNLKGFSEENEKETWLKSGFADLALAMRGGLAIDELADNIITFLAQYLNAQVGVFYIVEEDGSAILSASYAYTRRKNLDTIVRPGEGLVGQALKERKPIVLSNIPKDYVTVNSGLGEHTPRSLVVQPLIYEQKIKGLVELGSFQEFTDDQLQFLTQVNESVAVTISSARDRSKMQQLLEETQQNSEKLRHQQEELEAANQTLEEQAQALKQSEEELTAQKDMLQESNMELQLKTKDLERQKAEIENARAELQNKAYQLSNSSKYKSEFLANMSHELRTPLNSLLLLSQSLLSNKEGNLTEDQIEDLRIIHSGGTSLLTLINDILDLSKTEAGKMQVVADAVDVNLLAKRLQGQFKTLAREKNLHFDVSIDEAAVENFFTDQHRLEQILRNLLSNAFKFTHQGSVTLKIGKAAAGTQMTSKLSGSNILAFSVKDTGIGIAEKNQSVIFEAFQQADGSTSRSYGGTGLGLTISREMAALLGGEIQLQSAKGQGSEFILYIPKQNQNVIDNSYGNNKAQVPVEALPQDPTISATNIPFPEEKYVLIVEDNPQFGLVLSQLAENHGFKPLLINKGMEALKLVLSHSPKAIILDMGLPDTSGLKVLEALKASPDTRQIPVHIISAQDEDQEALKKGALGFLTKPAPPEELEQVFAKFETLIQKHIKHILLVEDDKATSEFIRHFLEAKDIQIHTAASGQLALQILRQQRIDCCILDLSLRDMNGFEFLSAVEQDAGLSMPPIVVYTARDLSEQEYKTLRSYTDKIILKDGYSPERLQEEVDLFLYSVDKGLPPSLRHQVGDNEISAKDLKGRKILLVDDDLRNVYALSKVLKDNGLKVSLADNGKLAVEKLQTEKDVDLVLMDIMMPVMDGYQAMKEIRTNISTSIPIIALTAKAMNADKEKCIEAGANDYMAKPVDINNLLSMMKVWCYH